MKPSVLVLLAFLVGAMAGAACGGNSSVTTPSTSTSTAATPETFSGSLALQGSSFYSFTVSAAGTVSISLASLAANTIGPASTSVVRLGLGVPSGTDCSTTSSVDTAAGLTAQLTAPVNADTYCVKISDIGNLTEPDNFTILIAHNLTSTPSTTAPTTETFASFLSIGGSTAHTFPLAHDGTISITLTSVTPSSVVGVGLGIRSGSGPTCSLTSSVNTTAGSTPQIIIPVDAGTYCAEVYDAGAVSLPGVAFSMTISHP